MYQDWYRPLERFQDTGGKYQRLDQLYLIHTLVTVLLFAFCAVSVGLLAIRYLYHLRENAREDKATFDLKSLTDWLEREVKLNFAATGVEGANNSQQISCETTSCNETTSMSGVNTLLATCGVAALVCAILYLSLRYLINIRRNEIVEINWDNLSVAQENWVNAIQLEKNNAAREKNFVPMDQIMQEQIV